MRKLIFYGITSLLFILLLLWHFSVSLTEKNGALLQEGASGQVFVFEDNNPVLNFKITYEGPLETREIKVESGGHAIVLFNAERKELYIYSYPESVTLPVDGLPEKDANSPRPSIWNLMFSKNAFFKLGRHSLTLSRQ